jgi:predicted PurR-regulated permease PerM
VVDNESGDIETNSAERNCKGQSLPEGGMSEPPAVEPFNTLKVSLALLSTLAVVAMLRWAQSVFIPFALAILISYALNPVVVWMTKLRIPRWISAAILLILAVIILGSLSYKLGAEGASAIAKLPESMDKLTNSLRESSNKRLGGIIKSFKRATGELEKAAEEATGSNVSKDQATEQPSVRVEQPAVNFHKFLWMGSTSALDWAGQIVLNLFLIYFLLSSGDLFKRKLVKIAGNTFAAKRITVQILDVINSQIQHYLLVQLFLSLIVWLLSWAAFAMIGLDNAMFWAIVAGVAHMVPYLGSAVVSAGTGLVGFLQFETLEMGLLVAGSSAAIATIAGMIIMPWLTSRAVRMNAGAVFITLLLWSWIWGIWGLLLGTPIVMAFKNVCDHIENLKPIGEILGD